MPPSVSQHEPAPELTLDQVEQVGRLLIPAVKQAIFPDLAAHLDKMQNGISEAIKDHRGEVNTRFEKVENRLTTIERLGWRAIGAASVVSLVASGIFMGLLELVRHVWK